MEGNESQSNPVDFESVLRDICKDHTSRYRDGKPSSSSAIKALRDVCQEYRDGLFGKCAESCREVRLTWTSCNFGGVRPWFVCPDCGYRVALLFDNACRRCRGIKYESQYAPPLHTHRARAVRIRDRFGQFNGNLFEFVPHRPKRMRGSMYEALLVDLQTVELDAVKLIAPDLPGMQEQVCERFKNARAYEAMRRKYWWMK